LESGSGAVDFVGGGHAVEHVAQMEPADLWMISTCDTAIEPCCRELCRAGLIEQGTIVLHCSGSLPSTVLEPAGRRGASIASLHPVKSFADPAVAVETFAGTFCALEGDRRACEVLDEALRRCSAVTFPVNPELKTIYHAATVVVCNYLVALMEVGLRCFEQAGLPRETALQVIEPIVTGTVDNVFKLGPAQALSGPIARGEQSVVETQCEALGRWDEQIEGIYRSLGRVAVELSAAQGNADPGGLAAIAEILQR
jgi:predicted short-subunit dehydrogenase-like oxidoreductase (DUF2520 family)